MFVTAFLWTLGVFVGAAAGLIVLAAATWVISLFPGSNETRRVNEASLAALNERNQLTAITNNHLFRIADALEEYADKR